MKKFIVILIAVLSLCSTLSFAQTYERKGMNFTQTGNASSANVKETPYTWTTKDGKTYKILINTKSGRCTYKAPNKEGKLTTRYIPNDAAKEICKEMHIKWVEPKKKDK